MTLSTRRGPALTFLALLLLLCGPPAPCFADYDVADVSAARAKELGIAVRSQPSANNDVWVQVEFQTAGPLKEFRWADLELTQGGKRLVTAALMPRKPTRDSTQLDFYIDPAALTNATVTIFVADQPLGGTGYRLKMRDSLAPAASR